MVLTTANYVLTLGRECHAPHPGGCIFMVALVQGDCTAALI